MDVYANLQHMTKMLKNLDGWIGKAVEHAAARSFDPNILAQSRLAPDAFTFARQVQSCCDIPKYMAAYASGKTAPSNPDTETTIAELRARIATALAHIETYSASDFDGAGDRKAAPSWMRGASIKVGDYLMEIANPNFHFHATMAYAILRHNGVPLGKQDFLGHISIIPPA